MARDHVYHWKHGWIPLDHTAALSKAKGNHKAAEKMLGDAKSPHAGIHSREHVAKAAVGLSSIPDAKHRAAALSDVHAAADRHNAHDVLPKALQRPNAPKADAPKALPVTLRNGGRGTVTPRQGGGVDLHDDKGTLLASASERNASLELHLDSKSLADAHAHLGFKAPSKSALARANTPEADLYRVKPADAPKAPSLEPSSHTGPEGTLWRVKATEVQAGDTVHVPSIMGGKTKRYRIEKSYGPKGDGGVNVDATDLETGRAVELTLQGDKKHDIVKRQSTLPAPRDLTAGLPDGYKVRRDTLEGYGPVSTFSAYGPDGKRVAHSVHGEDAARKAALQHHTRAQQIEADRVARQKSIADAKTAREAAHAKVVADGRAAYAQPDTVDVADQVATNHLVERMHNSPAAMQPAELAKIAGSGHVAQHHRDKAQAELNAQALKRVQFMDGANDQRALNARLVDARQSMPAGPMRDALIAALERQLANVGGGSSTSSPKAWTSPRGMHVPLKDVDEAHLAALYAAETNDADPGAFTRAYDQANTATRHAFKAGYRNPRVSDRGSFT